MDHSIQDKVSVWLSGNYDEATKNAINSLQPDELADSFYRSLEFGTGGLRGIMGVGTNRMNKYTVGMATQGFANYLKKTYGNEPMSVVIGHDSRNNSRFFAETTAGVFAANGIQVYFMLLDAWVARRVWFVQLRTILKNTMDTKLIGMMEVNLCLRMIKM